MTRAIRRGRLAASWLPVPAIRRRRRDGGGVTPCRAPAIPAAGRARGRFPAFPCDGIWRSTLLSLVSIDLDHGRAGLGVDLERQRGGQRRHRAVRLDDRCLGLGSRRCGLDRDGCGLRLDQRPRSDGSEVWQRRVPARCGPPARVPHPVAKPCNFWISICFSFGTRGSSTCCRPVRTTSPLCKTRRGPGAPGAAGASARPAGGRPGTVYHLATQQRQDVVGQRVRLRQHRGARLLQDLRRGSGSRFPPRSPRPGSGCATRSGSPTSSAGLATADMEAVLQCAQRSAGGVHRGQRCVHRGDRRIGAGDAARCPTRRSRCAQRQRGRPAVKPVVAAVATSPASRDWRWGRRLELVKVT